jgi:hypothetical protein
MGPGGREEGEEKGVEPSREQQGMDVGIQEGEGRLEAGEGGVQIITGEKGEEGRVEGGGAKADEEGKAQGASVEPNAVAEEEGVVESRRLSVNSDVTMSQTTGSGSQAMSQAGTALTAQPSLSQASAEEGVVPPPEERKVAQEGKKKRPSMGTKVTPKPPPTQVCEPPITYSGTTCAIHRPYV